MPEKTFTEEEVSEIMGHAARLQAKDASAGQVALTLDEIKMAAAEAGINPQYVEVAAAVSSDHGDSYWSIPTTVGRSVVVRGTLTDERWNRMVAFFSRKLGGPGTGDVQGMHRSWSRGAIHITAEEAGDEILIHAEAAWGKELELPIALTLVGAIAAGVTGALAFVSMEWTMGVVAAMLALLVGGSFAAFRSRTVNKEAQLLSTFATVLDHCAAILLDEARDDRDKLPVDIESRSEEILPSDAVPEGKRMSYNLPKKDLRLGK